MADKDFVVKNGLVVANGNISVTGTVDGRDVATDGTKLDGIESGATADQTASEILTAIKTVDGAASGLDADLLDGQQGSYYLDWTNTTNKPDPVITLAGDLSGSVTLTDLTSGTLTATVGTLNQNTTGNAATATTLQTPRTIGGVSFDGSANINLPGVNTTGNQNTTGSAATLTTTRAIQVSGAVTGTANFDGSAAINIVTTHTADPVITLTGAVTGSGTMTNLGSVSIATTATADPTLTLAGDATGSATFTNLGNATLTVAVADDSHNHSSSSGNFTVNGILTTTANTTIGGSLQIDGDLTVSGETVTINVTDLAVEDNMIYLNSGSVVSNPDLGFAGNYNDGTYAHAGFFRDATDGYFKPFKGYTLEPDASAFIDTSHASFALADIQAANFRGALVGNASTATTLQTARTIGGVSFNGSANINLPGVNTAGNQNTSGNAASATILQTARTIGGVSFNGSANIDLPGVNTAGNQNTSGNAATASAWQTARTITLGGVLSGSTSIDGSGNVTLTAAHTSDPDITLTGAVTGTGTMTNLGSVSITTTATADPTITLAGDLSGSVTLTNLTSGTLTATVGTLNQNTTGTAAIATTITLVPDNSTNATNYPVFVDAATGNENPRTDTGFTYNPSTGVLTSTTFSGALSGNATTATTLQTPRTINGVSFNGSANITVTATATNALTIGSYLTGSSYNGSSAITIAADATSANTASKLVARDASGNFSAGVITASGLTIGAITLPATDGTNGQVLTTDGSGNVTFADAGGGGSSSFLGLGDTPSSYSGASNQLVGVNAAENALEFVDEIEISEFVLSAVTAPTTPAADSMAMYVTASGTTPNREVSYKMKNELGQEIIISSILV